ncbi:MAG: lytic transglycosylase domain-containing protein [Deltaproteobacteria bacterium]|nr:lytic transglycosylase domain-containing protein [Deltaproteobacteria bacterium]
MVKRPRKTLARTLNRVTACSQTALILILFAPALVAFYQLATEREDVHSVGTAPEIEIVAAERPDELVKIFAVVKSHRPDIGDTEAWRVSEVILEESAKRNLDPMMVLAVIQVESRFQYAAVSPMGARGIMQIMPETGKFLTEALSGEYGLQPASFRPESLDDPLLNIRLGVYYLHDLAKQFRSLNLALLAYNAGPAEIQNRLENNIAFSEEYATLVFDAYHSLKKSRPPAF